MNKKRLLLLLIGTLFTSAAFAVGKPTKRKTEVAQSATISLPKTVAKLWKPIAFELDIDRLPPRYQGLDPSKFLGMFEAKVSGLMKGEFETSEEFAQRTANKDALLSPLNTSDAYAFRIRDITLKYDADAQVYFIESGWTKEGYSCHEIYASQKFKDWITCRVSRIYEHNDTYVGSNAFGVTRKIDRTRAVDFLVALAKDSAVLSSAFTKGEYDNNYTLQNMLHVPLAKARNLKGMDVAVLFIGRTTDAKLIEWEDRIKPEIDLAFDVTTVNKAVPFELKKIVYYVVQTGEILDQTAY